MRTKIKNWFKQEWLETKTLFKCLPAWPFAILCAALIAMNFLANKGIVATSWLSIDAGIIVSWVSFLAGDTLVKRLDQVDELIAANAANEKNINELFDKMKITFQKVGLVKYDAFHEMGGKLSFSLALLNETNDGFVLNAVHSRDGCYTYVKEIIGGNSIIILADEEQEALDMAKEAK